MGKHLSKAIRQYIDCTNLNWYHKSPIHWFDQFGGHFHPVQLMWGRTAHFKYFELAMDGPIILYAEVLSHGCTTVHRLYEFKMILQMSHPLTWSIWPQIASCTVDVRTYSKFQWSVQRYCGIPGNYGCTPVQKLYESRIRSQMFDAPFQSFWWQFGSFTVDVRMYSLF